MSKIASRHETDREPAAAAPRRLTEKRLEKARGGLIISLRRLRATGSEPRGGNVFIGGRIIAGEI